MKGPVQGWSKGSRRAPGFLLVEMAVALAVAAVAVGFVWQGLAVASAAEQRRHFYTRCTEFLETDFYSLVYEAAPQTPELSGTVAGDGPPVRYRLVCRAEPAVPGLTRVSAEFTMEPLQGPPLTTSLVTFNSQYLRFRQLEQP